MVLNQYFLKKVNNLNNIIFSSKNEFILILFLFKKPKTKPCIAWFFIKTLKDSKKIPEKKGTMSFH